MTAPAACLASLPVSKLRVLPLIVSSRVVIKDVKAGLNRWHQELFPDVQTFDQIRVTLRVFGFEVVEESTAAADQHQQSAARMMILRVRFEMLRQIVDAF